MKKIISSAMALFTVMLFASSLFAGDTCTRADVMKAVDKAASILEKEGKAGLEKVGKIRFCNGNYVFVNDLKGKTLMHIKSHLIGSPHWP